MFEVYFQTAYDMNQCNEWNC